MNFLLVGPPGSGKTTAACTAIPPIGLVDVDGKASQMVNIQHLLKSGDVEIIKIKSKLVEDRLAYRAAHPEKGPALQPKGYIEVIEILNDAIDQTEGYEKYNTIVLDSLTRLTEHLKRLLIYHRSKGKFGKFDAGKATEDINWPSWGSYLSNLEEIFNASASFFPDTKHFICCVHQKKITEKDLITKSEIVKEVRPMVDGQMCQKLAGYFNEVYYMEKVSKKGRDTLYHFMTDAPKYDARTSLNLGKEIPPDISRIIKVHLLNEMSEEDYDKVKTN